MQKRRGYTIELYDGTSFVEWSAEQEQQQQQQQQQQTSLRNACGRNPNPTRGASTCSCLQYDVREEDINEAPSAQLSDKPVVFSICSYIRILASVREASQISTGTSGLEKRRELTLGVNFYVMYVFLRLDLQTAGVRLTAGSLCRHKTKSVSDESTVFPEEVEQCRRQYIIEKVLKEEEPQGRTGRCKIERKKRRANPSKDFRTSDLSLRSTQQRMRAVDER